MMFGGGANLDEMITGYFAKIPSCRIFAARIATSKNSDRTDIARKFHVRGEPWPVKLNRVISFRAMDSHGFAKKHCAGILYTKDRRAVLSSFSQVIDIFLSSTAA